MELCAFGRALQTNLIVRVGEQKPVAWRGIFHAQTVARMFFNFSESDETGPAYMWKGDESRVRITILVNIERMHAMNRGLRGGISIWSTIVTPQVHSVADRFFTGCFANCLIRRRKLQGTL